MLGNVTGVHAASKQVIVKADDKIGIAISYDYQILARGDSQLLRIDSTEVFSECRTRHGCNCARHLDTCPSCTDE
jgi:hypothetical protein